MVTTRSQKLSKKATDVKKNFEQTNKQIKLKKTNANNKQKPNKPSQSDRFKIEISNSIKNLYLKLEKIESEIESLKNISKNERNILIENLKKQRPSRPINQHKKRPKHDQVIHYLSGFMDF